jgi:hypothetical protein
MRASVLLVLTALALAVPAALFKLRKGEREETATTTACHRGSGGGGCDNALAAATAIPLPVSSQPALTELIEGVEGEPRPAPSRRAVVTARTKGRRKALREPSRPSSSAQAADPPPPPAALPPPPPAASQPQAGPAAPQDDAASGPPRLLPDDLPSNSAPAAPALHPAPAAPASPSSVPFPPGGRECCVGEGLRRVCWARTARGRPFRILFHNNELNLRGTTVGLFNYAAAWEELACGESYIATNYCTSSIAALPKFEARFPGRVLSLPSPGHKGEDGALLSCPSNPPPPGLDMDGNNTLLNDFLVLRGIDAFFTIQSDTELPSFLEPNSTFRGMTLIQGVFSATGPERDPSRGRTAYAAVSDAIPVNERARVLPRIIDFGPPPPGTPTLRSELGLSEETHVFCRHGGEDTFDVPFAMWAVCKHAHDAGPSAVFLFLNTRPFDCPRLLGLGESPSLPNVVFLPGTSDDLYKRRFVASCDACLNARIDGETFGQQVAECSMAGKPLIAYGSPRHAYHFRFLGTLAFIFNEPLDLIRTLREFNRTDVLSKREDYMGLYARFSRTNVLLDLVNAFKVLDEIVAVEAGTPMPPQRLLPPLSQPAS